MNNKELATKVLELVGGEKNIQYATHCATRLRLNLHDESMVKLEAIDRLEGVLKAQIKSGQLQVVLGAKVDGVFEEFTKMVDISDSGIEIKSEKKKKNPIAAGIETLAGVFGPVIPVLIGCGMVKSLSAIITTFGILDAKSGFVTTLNLVGDLIFYFFPFFLAVSAAKKFKTSEFMAVALAGAFMYPTIMDGAKNAEKTGITSLDFLGLPVLFVNYKSTIIPIILSVWVLSIVYRKVDKLIPETFRILLTPMLVLFIMVPLELIAIGPVGIYLGRYIALGIQWAYSTSGILGAFLFGTFRPLLVMFGMHYAVTPINTQLIAEFGRTYISPAQLTGNMAQAGACLAVFILAKNKVRKSGALSSGVTALFGITEPAMYGYNLKYKKPMICAMVSGGIGAAYVNFFGGAGTTLILPGLLALPTYVADSFIHIIIGVLISIFLALGSTIILGIKEEKDEAEKEQNSEASTIKLQGNVSISAPIAGEVKALSQVNDKIFSQEVMGKGAAIVPKEGKVYAPFDGEVEAIFHTKHAIGLRSEEGIELLIHIGIDTVNLEGKYFTSNIKQNQKIKKGDLLIEFDEAAIKKEGYDTTVMIVVTNSNAFKNVSQAATGSVLNQKEFLMIEA